MGKKAQSKRVIFRSGEKVDLVILEEVDVPLFLKWLNDEEVTQYLGNQQPLMESSEREWLADLGKNVETRQVFGVATKKGKLIGNVGLHRINHRHGTATAGAIIGEKSFWGKGYGSEAEYLLIKYAFTSLNLRKINAQIFSTNPRSLKAAVKNGATEEGRKIAQFVLNGELVDEISVAVFREDFLKLDGDR